MSERLFGKLPSPYGGGGHHVPMVGVWGVHGPWWRKVAKSAQTPLSPALSRRERGTSSHLIWIASESPFLPFPLSPLPPFFSFFSLFPPGPRIFTMPQLIEVQGAESHLCGVLSLIALSVALPASSGCLSTPNLTHPGTEEYQQARAKVFEPYPENEPGPPIIGAGPESTRPPKRRSCEVNGKSANRS